MKAIAGSVVVLAGAALAAAGAVANARTASATRGGAVGTLAIMAGVAVGVVGRAVLALGLFAGRGCTGACGCSLASPARSLVGRLLAAQQADEFGFPVRLSVVGGGEHDGRAALAVGAHVLRCEGGLVASVAGRALRWFMWHRTPAQWGTRGAPTVAWGRRGEVAGRGGAGCVREECSTQGIRAGARFSDFRPA